MVQNNKVLTVSYGTFSCTLEGFEDSFDTMKAIAEYFRDLAADDRYFGAEPPQPDAEMLAHIAQREISRQVEARQSDSGIVLRAAEPSAAIPAAPAVAEPVSEPAALQEPAQELVPEPPAPEPPAPEPAAPEPAAEPVAEPVAEAASAEAVRDEPEAIMIDGPEAIEIDGPDSAVAEIAEDLEEDFEENSAESFFDMPVQAEVEPEEPVEELAAEPVAAPSGITPDTAPAAESIAAKLQRIRAVVSQSEHEAEDEAYEEEYTEDEHAEMFIAQTAADISDALAEDDAAELAEEDDGDDELAAVLDRLDAGEAYRDDQAATGQDEAAEAAQPSDESPLILEHAEEPVSELEEEELSDSFEDALDMSSYTGADTLAEEDVQRAEDGSEDSIFGDIDEAVSAEADAMEDEDGDDELMNILGDRSGSEKAHAPGRVLKVKRADFDTAVATGDLEAFGDEDDAGTAAGLETQDDAETSLSVEDEADLMRELAEVEADLRKGLDDFQGGADQVTKTAGEGASDVVAPAAAEPGETASEDDLSRLLATADEKLDDPENSSSREAYSHLRAARAATQAERSAGGTMGTRISNEPYREDLADVVRPRRPVATASGRDRRTEGDRPAPLKLVAEQRIDTEDAKRGPVRPRRVAAPLEDVAATDDGAGDEVGFEAYAREMGAKDLPDLLEAAASYMSFVEGREQFSRPQLMNKVRQVEDQDFNREDGLRSFGQLLRDGKIEKTGGGRFSASGLIGFRPDEREAG